MSPPSGVAFIAGGDSAAAMGFVKQGLAVRSFFSGGWLSLRRRLGASRVVLCSRRTAAATSGVRLKKPRAPRHGSGLLFSERFLFFLPGEAFFTPTGNLLSASEREEWRRLHYDVFGSGRGTSTLNLTERVLLDTQRRWRGCAVPKLS